MNAATEFDVGPLTWVKGEIDQALQRAGDALAQHEAGGDKTPLKFCQIGRASCRERVSSPV